MPELDNLGISTQRTKLPLIHLNQIQVEKSVSCSTIKQTITYRDLASEKRFETHLATNWPTFGAKRRERLKPSLFIDQKLSRYLIIGDLHDNLSFINPEGSWVLVRNNLL
jgi:hypothetical protein